MVDEQVLWDDIDQWEDADLADPENLPTEKRVIGEVTGVEIREARFDRALKDGRTVVPVITLTITSRAFANGERFDDRNYMRSIDADFWVGKPDTIGRNSLARLVKQVAGITEEEAKALGLRRSALMLKGALVSFDVEHQESKKVKGLMFQRATRIKPATDQERALLMA